MLIIYHSREALTARQAGLLHMGWLPSPDDGQAGAAHTWWVVGAGDAYRAEGLWPLGLDRQGNQVYAVGRVSRPDVVGRAFRGVSELFGVDPTTYMLTEVGPDQAWGDLVVMGLDRLGLRTLARRLERRVLQARWGDCTQAVARVQAALSTPSL